MENMLKYIIGICLVFSIFLTSMVLLSETWLTDVQKTIFLLFSLAFNVGGVVYVS